MKKTQENAIELVRECLAAGLSAATFSAPLRGAQEPYSKIRVRPVQLKSGAHYQLEQFGGTKAFHRNVTLEELQELMTLWLTGSYGRAEIQTSKGSLQVFAKPDGGLSVLRKANPSPKNQASPAQSHDRAKHYILEEGLAVPFLVDLGVMTRDGTVVKSMYHKFRQINRFLEFIADVLPELRQASGETARELTIVDFGCGKSYLTFAVYYYLVIMQKLPVRIIGLDLKDDVIARCAGLAQKYGYAGLQFLVGDIADFRGVEKADLVISLHACDTASDLALAQAIAWQARVILAVPCCQHELNAQLSDKTALGAAAPGRAKLQAAFKHGIIRERMAALFTDVLRAEVLESQGYQVQILEYIDMDHTPKNLLIRAVRKEQPAEATRVAAMTSYRELRDFLGAVPCLEKALEPKS